MRPAVPSLLPEGSWDLDLVGEDATAGLGHTLALVARPGLVILLSGDLGAGKSTLARAFIRALLPVGNTEDIPSPTFTLVQTYGAGPVPIAHADLYRLRDAVEADELGLLALAEEGVVLVEWPERLEPDALGIDDLTINLSGTGASRRAVLRARGRVARDVHRLMAAGDFLATTDFAGASRRFLQGDVSSRRYERLEREQGGARAILMDMPAVPAMPSTGGPSYNAVAHRAESIVAVAAINNELCARGFSAPRIHGLDSQNGFALVEDLGDGVFGRFDPADPVLGIARETTIEVLAAMADQSWPETVQVDGQTYPIPPYDRAALEIEVALFAQWYWPWTTEQSLEPEMLAQFQTQWSEALASLDTLPRIWTLRDVHSPNLIWLENRTGTARVGLIDTQDCVRGHAAYDVVSFLQDARVTIAPEIEAALLAAYVQARAQPFDEATFRAAYAVLGAQRASKILGIFARLSMRDGRHGYLAHEPRVRTYLLRNLAHPVLAPLKKWYETLPGFFAKDKTP